MGKGKDDHARQLFVFGEALMVPDQRTRVEQVIAEKLKAQAEQLLGQGMPIINDQLVWVSQAKQTIRDLLAALAACGTPQQEWDNRYRSYTPDSRTPPEAPAPTGETTPDSSDTSVKGEP